MEVIENWAFSYCPMLQLISIKHIRSLGEGVFENTPIGFPHESKCIKDMSQFMELTRKYLRGDGVPMNELRAIDLLRRASEMFSQESILEFIERNMEDEKEKMDLKQFLANQMELNGRKMGR